MSRPSFARRGFTLTEILIALIVLSVVGAGLLRILVGQTRFMDHQEAWRSARSVSRSSLNRVLADLRMVEAIGGMESAAAGGQDFTVRVPYAFGVICSATATTATATLMPVDSAMFFAPGFSGFAWRNSAGVYTYVTAAATLNTSGTAANCTGPNIATVPAFNGSPAGRVVDLGGALVPVPPVGSIVFLFRRVRYEFKASVAVPGRIGLWRTMATVPTNTEEIAAPFDAAARVRFFVLNNAVAQTAVPAPLSDVRGLEFALDGISESTPRGSAAPMKSELTTSIFFENRPD
jgi:prepilin-type N-terminal cleavage/methylation domain-containing protein